MANSTSADVNMNFRAQEQGHQQNGIYVQPPFQQQGNGVNFQNPAEGFQTNSTVNN